MKSVPPNPLLRLALALALAFAFAFALAGCGSRDRASRAPNPGESATNVQSVFKDASEDVRQQAGEVVAAVQAQNPVAAYGQLENLSGRPSLTPEQQQAISDLRLVLVHQLQAQSAQGNAAAEELLNKYRASK